MSNKCCLGCDTNGTLFRFPKDEQRRQQWFKAVKMEYTIIAKFLCGRHFSIRQFCNKFIRKNAVPDINLERIIECPKELSNNSFISASSAATTAAELSAMAQQLPFSVLLLTDEQLTNYVTPDNQIKVVEDGDTIQLVKNSPPAPKSKPSQTIHSKTPMATLEMMLTTKEFEKMQTHSKLPTYKSFTSNKPVTLAPNTTQPVPLNIESNNSLQNGTDWKAQATILRKTVEEKLKANFEEKVTDNAEIESLNTLIQPTCSNVMSRVTESSQTGSDGFETCGLIQRSTSDGKFCLTCFHCVEKYEFPDWEQYMTHYNNQHTTDMKQNDCKIESVSVATKRIAVQQLPNTTKQVQQSLTEENYHKDNDNDADEDDNRVSLISLENENLATENIAVINFYRTDHPINLRFLEVLHAHSLLLHPRFYGPKIFDAEAEKFLKQFEYSMEIDDLHSSLKNARQLQRRFKTLNSAKKSILANEPQLKQYVNLLNNIVTLSTSHAFNCEHCSYYTLNENDLFKHEFKKHKIGNKSHICSCGLYFADTEGKEAHEATHNTEPNFTCEHCGLSFFSQKKVQNHIVLKHPDAVPNSRPHQCPKCDERFAQKYMLKYHILKHDPPRYKCETCGKAYRKAFDYKHHIKTHLNQRDFICEDCGSGFISKRSLKSHRSLIHKISNHACLPCKAYFTNYENLHAHMQKFHPGGVNLDRKKKQHATIVKRYQERRKAAKSSALGRKPPDLKCKQCGIEFRRFGELQKHKRQFGHYKGYRRYKCPHCNFIFNSYQTFIMHLRKKHLLPARYSDIKNFQPYNDDSLENIEVRAEENNANDQSVDAYEEVHYTVHNSNYTDNEQDEEVKYSILMRRKNQSITMKT